MSEHVREQRIQWQPLADRAVALVLVNAHLRLKRATAARFEWEQLQLLAYEAIEGSEKGKAYAWSGSISIRLFVSARECSLSAVAACVRAISAGAHTHLASLEN